jgi:glycosyltransferase involved in cell wall biosynthesis
VIRLGIDATSVGPDGKGIARVQRGTLRALVDLGRHELVVFARHPEELPEVEAVRVAMRPTIAWEQIGLARAFKRHRLDALLTWTERLPLFGGGPFAVWLFEPPTHRIAENRRVGASQWQRASDRLTSALWRRSLKRATLVFTGSAATAEAVRDEAPRARPLYPGLELPFPDSDGPCVPMPSPPYVLHLGSSDPRDDTPTALEAARRAGARLVVAGGYGGPADGAELVGRVSDRDLVALYRGAAAFLDTSLYEGFGYQVLEAMASGTPVVASDTTSIPEVVGDAALLCPPRDADAFADALRRVLDDGELAARLRAKGLARAADFTWERTARELADAVDEALA